ncbi:hypothetical protein LSUE1_G006964 [Lachnellula suecica]|uniref:Uncharacterized protein n=1 Tax=Lachnellula suecica TaxID=602035 RepID=A0A8T9C0B5_9HELO|nr:hypothetical protein LSUE1_G006964 [Lachnellula suecica]
MRLLTMQMHKLQDLEKAIADRDPNAGLTLAQLANLFGFLRLDGEGAVVGVEADYDDVEAEEDGMGVY